MDSSLMRGVALGGALAVVLTGVLATRSPVAASLRNGEPLSGIIIGTDLVDFARHSDTLMVWNYDPRRTRLNVLSIPRDTKINLPGYRFRRINEVFAYHYGIKKDFHLASQEVLSAVRYLLGGDSSLFDPRYYVHIDYDGFRQFVDLLGGIDVRVDEPLHYDDNAGHYHIHLEPGDYHLNGAEALAYVRFRGRSGDKGRILRQMEFLKMVAGKLSFPLLSLRWPRMLATVYGSVHTRLSPWDVVFLVLEAKHLRPDSLNPWLLPGQPSGAYWEMDAERTRLVLQQFLGIGQKISAVPVAPKTETTTVKVWNGSRRGGLALHVTRRLRAAKFDVLEWGNYNLRQTKTRVLDRTGDIEKAKAVARALGIESVFSDINPKQQTDVEVVLGDDYKAEAP